MQKQYIEERRNTMDNNLQKRTDVKNKGGKNEIPKLGDMPKDKKPGKQEDKIKKARNRYSMLILKVMGAIFGALIVAFGITLIVAGVKHKKLLKEEARYMTPPGQMVEVNGHNIHVFRQGDSDSRHTLVFISANRVVDDSIVLQPLFDCLDEYELIYVDRCGVGYSDDADSPKDIDSMLEETRTAVKAVSDSDKYVLVAAQSGGVEATYWACKYKDEVEAIVGLQMFLPQQYKNMDDDAYGGFGNEVMLRLVKLGAHRLSDTGTVTDNYNLYTKDQMAKRNALIAKNRYTRGMLNEDAMLVKNAKKVAEMVWPETVPMYLIYANPYMDPYLHENDDLVENYEELVANNEGRKPEEDYNAYYREYEKTYSNVKVEEMSGPDRLVVYNPQKIAEYIENYLDK